MKLLILNNQDSFVYNLVELIRNSALFPSFVVRKNDEITLEEINDFDRILISPGPGLPHEAGILPELLNTYVKSKSILGVCLGHQAIAACFGGKLQQLKQPLHGTSSLLHLNGKEDCLFKGLPEKIQIGHYHSWVVSPSLPNELMATGFDEKGNIMSLRHRVFDVKGIQFHPESILTPWGKHMIDNWLSS